MKQKGESVRKGEGLAVIYANDKEKLAKAKEHFLKNVTIESERKMPEPLIKEILS